MVKRKVCAYFAFIKCGFFTGEKLIASSILMPALFCMKPLGIVKLRNPFGKTNFPTDFCYLEN